MSNEPSALEPRPKRQSPRARILGAAYQCFEKYGIRGTTLEEIASRASVSRPTIYKYFGSKTGIVDHISMAESIKVSDEVKKRLVRKTTFKEIMTEALVLVVRIASQNPYILRIVENQDLYITPGSGDGRLYDMHRKWWGRLLAEALEKQELASDLNTDEIVSWICMAEASLLILLERASLTDAELRRWIERFYVDPLLAVPPRAAAQSSSSRLTASPSGQARGRANARS